jgi:class 3 adenylate cyclase
MISLDGTDHLPWLSNVEADRALGIVARFIEGEDAVVLPNDSLLSVRTVLLTDLVRHSEMMQRLGDERGRDVLRDDERITREVLKANGGTEVKTMGDGFMASSGSVPKVRASRPRPPIRPQAEREPMLARPKVVSQHRRRRGWSGSRRRQTE